MTLHILAPDDPALQAVKDSLPADMQLDIVPFADYRGRLDAALAAPRSTHEVIYLPGHLWIPEMAAAGKIQPLAPLLADGASLEMGLLPSVVTETTYNEQQYMIPLFSDGHILFYDPTLVDIDGLTVAPVIIPALARAAHAKSDKPAIALKAHPSEVFLDFLPYLLSAGGRVLDAAGKPAFNTAAGIKALENYVKLRELAPADTHLYGNEEIADALKTGAVAMAITWGGQAGPIMLAEGSIAADTYKTVPLTTPWNATWGAAIPANLPDEDAKAALAALLNLHTPALDEAVITAAGSPIRKASYNERTLAQYAWLAAQQHMLEHALLLPKLPEIGAVLGAFYENVYQALTGQKSAVQALTDVEKTVQQAINQ